MNALRRSATRTALALRNRNVVPKRFAGGAPTEYAPGSLDYIVRQYLPHDKQIVVAIVSGYFGIYLLSTLFSGGSKKEETAEAAPAPAAAPAAGGVLSMEDEGFGDWIMQEGNFEKYLNSFEA